MMQNPSTLSSETLTTIALAQSLAEKLAIAPKDWHQLKSNRKAQAGQELRESRF
jgi:hypothetical protein